MAGMGKVVFQFQRHLIPMLLITLVSTSSLMRDAAAGANTARRSLLEHSQNKSKVSALFVLGDSTLDAGTNNEIRSLLRANFKPYGMQYFGRPTGRISNGRIIADFVAEYIGLPFPEPYLKQNAQVNMMTGQNFASGGSGLLPSTGAGRGVITFQDQIRQFNVTKVRLEQTLKDTTAAFNLISNSLFLIGIGANDLAAYITESVSNPSVLVGQEEFIDSLVAILKGSIEALYWGGARKIVLLGLGPIGCTPGVLAALNSTSGECVQGVNTVGRSYNEAAETMVSQLRETYEDLRIILGNTYDIVLDLATNGEEYGFTAGLTACCGAGPYNGKFACGRPVDTITNQPTNLCDNVEEHLYWDAGHLTEKASAIITEKLWDGNSTFAEPYNIKTLVSL